MGERFRVEVASSEPAGEQPPTAGGALRRCPSSARLDQRGDEHGDWFGERHRRSPESDCDHRVADRGVVDGESDEACGELAVAADEQPADPVDKIDRVVGQQSFDDVVVGAWVESSCGPLLDSVRDLQLVAEPELAGPSDEVASVSTRRWAGQPEIDVGLPASRECPAMFTDEGE
jgi:hypothetical protein